MTPKNGHNQNRLNSNRRQPYIRSGQPVRPGYNNLSEAEYIAARILEKDERKPRTPKPVTIRHFSWDKP